MGDVQLIRNEASSNSSVVLIRIRVLICYILTLRQNILKNIAHCGHILPKSKPRCIRMSLTKDTAKELPARPAHPHEEHLMDRILPSLLEDDCCSSCSSLRPVWLHFCTWTWPGDIELDTSHELETRHFLTLSQTSCICLSPSCLLKSKILRRAK